MGNNLYYLLEKLCCIIIALVGLFMMIFPKKCFKPELLEKKNGILLGRIIGVIFASGGIIALVLQFRLNL